MENDSRFRQLLLRFSERLSEQAWFQQLRAKWDELDQQSKMYLKSALAIGALVLVMVVALTSIWKVHKLKRDITEKSDLLTLIESSHEEIKRLQELSAGAGGASSGEAGPWTAYLESKGVAAGIDKASLTVEAEKPGPQNDLSNESLFEINIKHVNIKQIVRYAFQLENGNRPVKVRNLKVDTHSDPSGYMDSTISISAFTLKSKEGA